MQQIREVSQALRLVRRAVTSECFCWLGRVILGLALTLVAAQAQAAPGDIASKFPVNDKDPISSLPSAEERNQNPVEFGHHLQDLIARAEGAFRKQQYESAAKFYEALARVAPERAVAFSRLCVCYGRLGKAELASANCATAIRLGGAKVIDHLRFINLTLQKTKFSQTDADEIEASLEHLRKHAAENPQQAVDSEEDPASHDQAASTPKPANSGLPKRTKEELIQALKARQMQSFKDPRAGAGVEARAEAPKATKPIHLPTEIEVLTCKLASRMQDAARLTQCMDALRALKVKEELLFPFQWAQALIQQDSDRAAALIEEGKKLGLADETLAAMALEQEKAFASRHGKRWALVGLALVVLGAGGIAVARSYAKRRKPPVPIEA